MAWCRNLESAASLCVSLQLFAPVELVAASAALKLFDVEMPVNVVAHVTCGGKPLVTMPASERLFSCVRLQVVVQAGLMAQDLEAGPVGTLVPLQTFGHDFVRFIDLFELVLVILVKMIVECLIKYITR